MVFMRAEIISIGTELLLGHIANTNAQYLSKELAECGIDVHLETTVGDNVVRIKDALKDALSRADFVITTGGLGPTIDDVTLEAISRATGKKLIFCKDILKKIGRHFKETNIKMPQENRRQAYLPEGATELPNSSGTAPGFIVNVDRKLIAALPGVPKEMRPMVEESLIPYLKKKSLCKAIIKTHTIRTSGVCESGINAKVKDLLRLKGAVTVGIYAHPLVVDLKITAKSENSKKASRLIEDVARIIRKRVGKHIFTEGDEEIEAVVARLLMKKHKTLAVAESATGGKISDKLTNIPGASKYFLFSAVTYSNQSKTDELLIPASLIKEKGAVSEEVAHLMATNVRLLTNTDYGLGITGIFGPTGATKTKPVGLVYIAVSDKKGTSVKQFNLLGDRKLIKTKATIAALDLLRRRLLE